MRLKKALSIILCSVFVMCMGTAYSYAASSNSAVTNATVQYYTFYLDLPKNGVTDLATPRTKVSSSSYAYYDLDTVTNGTGHELYLNVRSESGGTIVGNARAIPTYVSGTSLSYVAYVYYKSGYGSTGTKYRPSGQTSNEANTNAYIHGKWRP